MDLKLTPSTLRGTSEAGSFESAPKFRLDYSNRNASTVSGSGLLAQLVIKALFTYRGSCLHNPAEGTLLPSTAGAGNNIPTELSATIIEDAISSVEASIKQKQLAQSSYTPEETLESIKLKSLRSLDDGLDASIIIKNSLGESSLLRVGV